MSLSSALAELDYPCRYPFKLFCHPDEQIIGAIADAVAAGAPDWDPDSLTRRESRNGKYVAITCIIEARSAEQIEAIYASFCEIKGILTSL